MEYGLQPVLAVALGHDRRARVEVDVQVLGLTCGDGETARGDLPGRDLHAGLGFAREKQLSA